MPNSVHGSFVGHGPLTYQQQVGSEVVLILAAIVAIYLVLGILYESYCASDHDPFDAALGRRRRPCSRSCSTRPNSAGVIALIGVILLIGIVKKNAIMMIDFAIEAQRVDELSPRDAIYKASLLRSARS